MPRGRKPASDAGTLLYEAGVTQGTLAQHLGVSQAAVSNYLNGRRTPPATFKSVLRVLVGPTKARRITEALPS